MKGTHSTQIRVAIVDDHQLVCAALAELLKADARFAVVEQTTNAAIAESLLKRDDLDVVLLDLQLRNSNGLQLLQAFNGRPAVCVVSMHTDENFVKEAIRMGALGYVSKQAAPDELLQAIAAVSLGKTYLSADVERIALSARVRRYDQDVTDREAEVLRLAASGMTSIEIGEMLNISRRTAEAHRANLMKKLALRTQTDLIRYALRHRIIMMPPVPGEG